MLELCRVAFLAFNRRVTISFCWVLLFAPLVCLFEFCVIEVVAESVFCGLNQSFSRVLFAGLIESCYFLFCSALLSLSYVFSLNFCLLG